MKFLVIVAVGFLICLASLFVWILFQNRASEKIWFNVISAGAAGLVALTITCIFSLEEKARKESFMTNFIYEEKSKQPLIPRNAYYMSEYTDRNVASAPISNLVEELAKIDSKLLDTEDLYFDLLIRKILDLMFFLQSRGWDSTVSRRDSAFVRSMSVGSAKDDPKAVVFKREDFKKIFSNPEILEVGEDIFNEMKFPPGSEVQMGNNQFGRFLKIKNSFVDIEMNFSFETWGRGTGVFQKILKLSDKDSNRFRTASYSVNLNAKFNRYLSGHPDMKRYEGWVNTLFDEIDRNFNEAKLFQKVRDNHLLLGK